MAMGEAERQQVAGVVEQTIAQKEAEAAATGDPIELLVTQAEGAALRHAVTPQPTNGIDIDQDALLADVEAMFTDGGNLMVQGDNAREAVKRIDPKALASALPRGDGSLLVPKRFAGPVMDALQGAKQRVSVAFGGDGMMQAPDVAQFRATVPTQEEVQDAPKAQSLAAQAAEAGGQEGAQETRDELLSRYKRAELFSDESFALSDSLKQSTRKEVGAKIAAGEMPVFDTGSDTFATITPSAQQPGMFQVTRYNRSGVMGDSQYRSVDDALAGEFFHQKRMIPQAEAEQRFAEALQAEAEYQARTQQPTQAPTAPEQSRPAPAQTQAADKPKRQPPARKPDPVTVDRTQRNAEDLRAMAQDAGWAEEGGKLIRDAEGKASRTKWIPRAEWFMTGMEARPDVLAQHIEDAAQGKWIPVKSARTIEGMSDWLDAQRGQSEPNEDSSMFDFPESGYDELSAPARTVVDAFDDADPMTPQEEAEAMRALGFTEQEIQDAVGQTQAGAGSVSEPVTTRAQEDGAGNQEAGRAQAEAEQEGLTLDTYTNADIAEQDAAQRERAENAARAIAASNAPQAVELDLRAKSHEAERDGDVGVVMGNGDVRFVSLADAVAAARSEIDSGTPATPFQIHNATGIRIGDAQRVIDAAQQEVNELSSAYTANERGSRARKSDGYTQDIFGAPLPKAGSVPNRNRQAAPIAGGEAIRAAGEVDGAKFATEAGPRVVGELKTAYERIESALHAAHTLAGLRKNPQERFQVLVLDASNKPISVLNLFAGATTQTGVYPEVVTKAVYETPGAAKIWYAHNHPSGRAEASPADVRLTEALSRAFGSGTGVEVAGHIIIANDSAVELDAGGATIGRPFKIPAGARTNAIKITERRFKKVGTLGEKGEVIDSPDKARQMLPKITDGKPGVVFLNAQNGPVAFLPMSPAQMTTLRDGKSARLLFGAAARSNASAAMLHFPAGTNEQAAIDAADNIVEALHIERDIKVLDAFVGSDSLVQRGVTLGKGSNGIFASRSDSKPRTGLTRESLVQSISTRFPSLTRAVESALRRGDEGKPGGVVVVERAEDLAGMFASKTGRSMEEAQRVLGLDQPAILESALNPVTLAADFLSDLSEAPAFVEQGFGALNVPGKRAMLHAVLLGTQDLKILKPIIEFIPVDVMDVLSRQQLSPEVLLNDESMLQVNADGTVVASNPDLTIPEGFLFHVARGIAAMRAKELAATANRGRTTTNRGATSGAVPGNAPGLVPDLSAFFATEMSGGATNFGRNTLKLFTANGALNFDPSLGTARGHVAVEAAELGRMLEAAVIDMKNGGALRASNVGHGDNSSLINGVYDSTSGLTFLVAPNLTERTAPAVLLHEATHGKQRAEIDRKAMELIETRQARSKPLRDFLFRVEQRMEAAGESGNATEAAAYIVEEAVVAGRQAGFSAADSKLMNWIDTKFGKRVGDIVRDFAAMVRAWMLRAGVMLNPSIDDLVALAKLNVRDMGRGNVEGEGGFSRASQTASEAFRKWFSGSKVVDENGAPLVVYHGTTADIEGAMRAGGEAWNGGIFFTDSAQIASSVYAGGSAMPNTDGVRAALGRMSDDQLEALAERLRDRAGWGDFWLEIDEPGQRPPYADQIAEHAENTFDDYEGGTQAIDSLAAELGIAGRAPAPSSNVIPSYLSLQNPLVVDGSGMDFDPEQQAEWIAQAKAEGHDGIVIRNYSDGGFGIGNDFRSAGRHDVYVAFRPDQIKSAVGNNGNFDPTDRRINFSRAGQATMSAPATAAQPAQAAPRAAQAQAAPPEETRFQAFQRKAQDKLNRFTVIKEWLAEHGVVLSEQADVYKAEERMHSRFANKAEDFREKTVKPLVEKIQKAGYSMDEVAQFLHAQHAEERNIQIFSINPQMPDGGSGMKTADANAILAQAPAELARLANELRQITVSTKQILLDNGIISQDMADAWDATYQNYVPLKGGPDQGGKGAGKGLKANYKGKRALGHQMREEGEWIVENILADHERALMLAEKNRIGQSLLKMAIEVWRDDLLTVGKPEKRGILKNNVAYEVLFKGRVVGSFQSLEAAKTFRATAPAAMKNASPSEFGIRKVSDPTVAYMASPMLAENEVNVYVRGQAIRVQINDELLARAYGNMGVEALGAILRVGATINGYFSKIYTGYNPEFILTNIVRDFTTGVANVTGEEGAMMALRAAKDYPGSFRDLFRYARTGQESQWIKMYREDGGNTGAAYLSDLERLGDEIGTEYAAYKGVMANLKDGDVKNAARAAGRKAFDKTLVWVERINQAGENAMRLSIYKAMIESGKSRAEAASLAKNATVNFNRKGEIGGQMNAIWLFYNAGVQGTAAIAHANIKGKHKWQARAVSAGILGLGYTMAVALGSDDEDEYDKLSDYTKARNVVFKSGDGWVKIPVPYGYGFFWNMGRAIADAERKGDWGKAPWQVASSFIEEFTPFGAVVAGDELALEQMTLGALPTLAQIPASVGMNRTTMGGPMYPESSFDKHQPDNEKMWRATKGTIPDMLAQALDQGGVEVSPETIKYLTRTFTGGAGQFVSSIGDAAWLTANGASLEVKEQPFVRKFYTETDVREARSAYYAAVSEAEKAVREGKSLLKMGDYSAYGAYRVENQEFFMLDKMAKSYAKAIKASRDRADTIRADKGLGIKEKREKLKEIEAKEQALYDRYLEVFRAKTR